MLDTNRYSQNRTASYATYATARRKRICRASDFVFTLSHFPLENDFTLVVAQPGKPRIEIVNGDAFLREGMVTTATLMKQAGNQELQ